MSVINWVAFGGILVDLVIISINTGAYMAEIIRAGIQSAMSSISFTGGILSFWTALSRSFGNTWIL